MSNKVKIAVISDIHFDNSDVELNPVEEALLKSLVSCEFESLIVNGDVSREGCENGFNRAVTFFTRLLEEKEDDGLTIDNIYFVVGNHDCDWDEISRLIESKEFKIFSEKYYSDSKIRNGFLKKKNLENFKPIFNEYIAFLKDKLKVEKYKNAYVSEDEHWLKYLSGHRELGDNIIIFANNSCWYCHKDSRGKLVLGTEIVKKNVKEIDKIKKDRGKIVISCLHHEISHLHWEEKYNIDSNLRSICEVSDIILTSDQHVPIQSPDYLESNNLVIATGSAYDNLNFPNSYKVLTINLESKDIIVDHYVGHNDGRNYSFNRVTPIKNYLKKGIKIHEVNPSYESRKFPFNLDLESEIDLSEEEFWENNLEANKQLNRESIENYLVSQFDKNFAVDIKKHIDVSLADIDIYCFSDFFLIFPQIQDLFLSEKIEKCFSLAKNKKYSLICSPYYLIEDKDKLENSDGHLNYLIKHYNTNIIKDTFENQSISFTDINFMTCYEVITEKKQKKINQMLERKLSSLVKLTK
ncbi:calcineurin-like phosphoesterase [Kordia sp. SMS9]|uniref:metallophosphoesterase family protein n=1 Tax=Kordia sp. SMS9 TaxID=2282170 RepID=UPI000E102DF1|nr:metallophosphoesterase [Kordia sp. SMS9]AXG69627.1 calcineurin-like phosphoesterase [Kordia sp. SMS9]